MDITENFQETYNEFLFRKADSLQLPIMGTFELTPICNMSCDMCYIQQKPEEVNRKGGLKSVDFWEKIFDQAMEAGMLFCLLTGGEIFTYPHFRELYERIYKKGVHIVLNTNGTLLDRETVEWLAKRPPRRLNISLYGATKDTYLNLCHTPSGLKNVENAFSLLNEYGIPYRVHGVLVPSNVKDYEGIKEICNHFRAPLELSYYMFPALRKEKDCVKAEERFTPEEMAQVAFHYRMDQCGGDGERWRIFVENKCVSMEHPEQRKYYGVDKILCRSGCSVFWVNWKGQVSGCGMEEDTNFSLEETSFLEAWNQITKHTEEVCLSKKCAVCSYRDICPVCAAAAFCETGKIDGTPEYLCSFSKQYAALLQQEWERIKQDETRSEL